MDVLEDADAPVGAGLKLENARVGEMSARVGATRATGVLIGAARRYVDVAAAGLSSALPELLLRLLPAGFGGAGRCGLRGVSGSSSAVSDVVALPE